MKLTNTNIAMAGVILGLLACVASMALKDPAHSVPRETPALPASPRAVVDERPEPVGPFTELSYAKAKRDDIAAHDPAHEWGVYGKPNPMDHNLWDYYVERDN